MGKGEKHSLSNVRKRKLISRYFLNVVHNNPVALIFAKENRFFMIF